METIIEIPVCIDGPIYTIPDKTHFEQNIINRHEELNCVQEKKVHNIQWWSNETYYVNTNDGLSYSSDHLGETWFTASKYADWKLDRLKESRWDKDGNSKFRWEK